jgi:DNA-binding NtrC family response regulator
MGKNSAAPNDYGLIGRSPRIAEVRRLIEKAARTRLPVLLLGESGSGKEVVARAIHQANPRGKLVAIDCGSLVGTLMESELFGHVKGAFSGAIDNKKGLVEAADGGTAFFDEIGDLPLEMQVKLLRLVQESEFRPVGALSSRKVDLRIVAATHRDLKAEVAAGRFRLDLYYRLNVFPIRLPALRDRREDIPLLVENFAGSLSVLGIPELSCMLEAYDWPGNVRELKHCVERIVAMRSEGEMRLSDLPSQIRNCAQTGDIHTLATTIDSPAPNVEYTHVKSSPVISVAESEKQAIANALKATNGERGNAARQLKISRTTLYRKMKEYKLV